MEKLGLNEIRKRFLDFFESKEHYVGNSFPLVPQNDNSLLLINAGMAPMKNYFTGVETPPSLRMVTCQKCIRTGDIDNVGKTSRHATFFEMLGNFSFGDYFKNESLQWGWEFLTEVLEMPEDKLWASVFLDDDEAYDIWVKTIGIPEDRIVRLGKDENFWEIGTGPCGPCSEIHFDRGPEYFCEKEDCKPGDEGDRIIEIWNHVFTQFNKTEEGEYIPLDHPNIDTGMGLERVACVMQDVDSIFDIDTFKVIRDEVSKLSNKKYGDIEKDDISIRIITDHIRAVSFMVGDGVMPGNSGRDYVLRRLLRRAARHGKLLGIKGAFLTNLVDQVIEISGEAYPELINKEDFIKKIISIEEARFQETIDQGMDLLNEYLEDMKKSGLNELDGKVAFKLYDTFGFPLDLTKEILEENKFTVDEVTFKDEMEKQKIRAREARNSNVTVSWDENSDDILDGIEKTEFVGYDLYLSDATVVSLINDIKVDKLLEGETGVIILDKTPFYAESGGQVADLGIIENDDFKFEVTNVTKDSEGRFYHIGKVITGNVSLLSKVTGIVDVNRRIAVSQNHTATHMLHKALKMVLGEHVNQAGSLVTPEALRFDFSHYEKVSNDDIKRIEKIVNDKIVEALEIEVINTDIESAKEFGATALFGEKYGNEVRVVKMEDYSMELCGGTHLENTSEVGVFKITTETAVASGVRRIFAATSLRVFELLNSYVDKMNLITDELKTNENDVINRVKSMKNEIKLLESENESLKSKLAKSSLEEVVSSSRFEINGINTIIASLDGIDGNTLRELGDNLINENKDTFILLASAYDGKVMLLTKTDKSLLSKGIHCGNIIREVAKITGGGGGGRPDMAQAGGKDISKIPDAIKKAKEIISSL
ncbi:alanine--tRNA ligase [Clostridiaceae bacterium HSG29]|nr:alanine--tRNA ligase [Clostridiaceae bacterium HSG29]